MFNPEYDFFNSPESYPGLECFMRRPDVNSALLTEEKKGGMPVFEAFFSLYPMQDSSSAFSMLLPVEDRHRVMEYLRLIIEDAELTLDLAESDIRDYSEVRAVSESECRELGQPTTVLAFGQWEGTEDLVVGLFFVPGISPETAIEELREFALVLSEDISNRN